MANIRIENLIGPFAIGAGSAVAELVENNYKATGGTKTIMRNAGMIGDVALGGYGVVNFMMDLNLPRQGSVETMGAGIAILTRRLGHTLGSQVLGLSTTAVKTGARLGGGGMSSARLGPGRYPLASASGPTLNSQQMKYFSVV